MHELAAREHVLPTCFLPIEQCPTPLSHFFPWTPLNRINYRLLWALQVLLFDQGSTKRAWRSEPSFLVLEYSKTIYTSWIIRLSFVECNSVGALARGESSIRKNYVSINYLKIFFLHDVTKKWHPWISRMQWVRILALGIYSIISLIFVVHFHDSILLRILFYEIKFNIVAHIFNLCHAYIFTNRYGGYYFTRNSNNSQPAVKSQPVIEIRLPGCRSSNCPWTRVSKIWLTISV